MKLIATDLPGAYLVRSDPAVDERGSFARLWCQREFAQSGIDMHIRQTSLSHNTAAGTVRGLHFQWPPSREAKLVRCQRGRIYDVFVDLRPGSPTFSQHSAIELNSGNHDALYLPPGFAHGFQTLEAECEVFYMMDDFYQPTLVGGARFDDPAFNISWPLPVTQIADRDRNYPDFDPLAYGNRYTHCLANPQPCTSPSQDSRG